MAEATILMTKAISEEDKDWVENYEQSFKEQLRANYDDPKIKGLVRVRCRNWLDLAAAIVKEYGDEGKNIVSKARFKSAKEVAEDIREKFGTDVQAIYRYYRESLPWAEPTWDIYLGDLPHKMTLRAKCQVGDYWTEKIEENEDCKELCWIYCSWDEEVARYLNPKIQCRIRKWIADGSPYCELVWTTE
jgi:hypothetical protein